MSDVRSATSVVWQRVVWQRRVLHVSGALAVVFALALPVSAVPITFATPLAPEVDGSTGSGGVTVVYDDVAQTLAIEALFTGLTGQTTVAHIHCCTTPPGTAGVAITPVTLPGFPKDLVEGTYSIELDLTDPDTYTAGFRDGPGGGTVGGAEAAIVAAMFAGTAYFNVHSTFAGGGEIRGFLQPLQQPVPEPSTLLLLGLAGAASAWGRRRLPHV